MHINTRDNGRWRILILLSITFVLVSGCMEKTTPVDSWQLDINDNILQENDVDVMPAPAPMEGMDTSTMSDPEITWLGHASFLFDNGIVVYTDPYNIGNNQKKADVVLITHDHADHLDLNSISKIATADTVFIAPQKAASQLEGVAGDVISINANESIDTKGISVSAVPAYNINKKFHPKGEGVGYVFTIGDTTIYQAGDTDFIPEMNDIDCDIAILPIGGTYTMDMNEAVKAASAIAPETVIPMHYNSIEGLEADAEEFKKLVEAQNPAINVRIL